jgi:TetR/AcrR family transcriptional regulator
MCLAWEGPANKLTIYSNPKEAMTNYIKAKIDLARARPFGSKLWASEALRGSGVVEDYLGNHLVGWIESRSQVFNHWITLGLIKPIDTKVLFYSIWATTQHYADCSEQIRILNGGKPLSDKQYARFGEHIPERPWHHLNGRLWQQPSTMLIARSRFKS